MNAGLINVAGRESVPGDRPSGGGWPYEEFVGWLCVAHCIFAPMVYKVIGLMSGSSLDGLDIAYVELQEQHSTNRQAPRTWGYQILQTACYPYPTEWKRRLAAAPGLPALDYQLLHAEYGHYLGERVLQFIEAHGLHYRVQLIASHGHTGFHDPARRMTAQLGDGAAIAATTGINVVSDLRAMDVALGGQGAPIVPIGEALLLPGYEFFLNLGGIANVSRHGRGPGGADVSATHGSVGGAGVSAMQASGGPTGAAATQTSSGGADAPATHRFVAFDVCPANRVLNALAADLGLEYDAEGALAAGGRVDAALLDRLNALPYYGMPYPKSLANEFGTETVLPMLRQAGLSTSDALRTYVEHIAEQVGRAVGLLGWEAGAAGLNPDAAEARPEAVAAERPAAGVAAMESVAWA